MDKKRNNLLTNTEFAFIIVGAMIGTGILNLSRDVAQVAKQDGWISVIIASIYPIYMVLLAGYISKKFPNDNILVVSKRCFGNILGSIFNFLFLIQFVVYATTVLASFSNVFRTFIIEYMTNIKVIAIILALSLYIGSKNIKELGRISEIIFYATILVVFTPLFSLVNASALNISPVFGAGIKNILKGSFECIFAYGGVEIIFLIYPFLRIKKNVKKFGLIAVFITTVIYTWSVFVTIYYLGPDITLKRIWPYITVAGSVPVPLINNFAFLFMFLWFFVITRNITLYCFAIHFIAGNLYSKLRSKKFLIVIYPILFCITYYVYPNEIARRNITGLIQPIFVIYSLLYATTIAFLVFIKSYLSKD